MKRTLLLVPMLTSSLLFGCHDPAKDKARATTSEAQPVAAESPTSPTTKTFTFDAASGSRVGWTGSKVTGKHEGGFRSFRGKIQVDPAAPEKAKVDVEIDTRSLYTDS